MKKSLLYILPLVCVVVLAGCRKTIQWDYYNTDVIILVYNSHGQNLLSERISNFRNNAMKIEYDGTIYSLKRGNTRAGLPTMNGFKINGFFDDARLLFGEFSVDTKSYRGETFTIDWDDGTSSVVKFDLYSTSNGRKEEPTVHEAIWVESGAGAGTRTDNSLVLTIVKD